MFDLLNIIVSEVSAHPYWASINCLVGAAIAFHGTCSIGGMTKRTPLSYWLAYMLMAIGGAGIAVGPFYGYWSANPASVLLNSGALGVILFKTFTCEKWRNQ